MKPEATASGAAEAGEIDFVHVIRVGWGDCDPARIAYTGRLPAFAVEAIDAWWLYHCDHDWYRFQIARDFGTPFVHVSLDMRSPVTPLHPLRCEVRLIALGTTSVRFAVFARQDGKLCFEGRFVTVGMKISTLEKMAIPDDIRARITPLLRDGA